MRTHSTPSGLNLRRKSQQMLCEGGHLVPKLEMSPQPGCRGNWGLSAGSVPALKAPGAHCHPAGTTAEAAGRSARHSPLSREGFSTWHPGNVKNKGRCTHECYTEVSLKPRDETVEGSMHQHEGRMQAYLLGRDSFGPMTTRDGIQGSQPVPAASGALCMCRRTTLTLQAQMHNHHIQVPAEGRGQRPQVSPEPPASGSRQPLCGGCCAANSD